MWFLVGILEEVLNECLKKCFVYVIGIVEFLIWI